MLRKTLLLSGLFFLAVCSLNALAEDKKTQISLSEKILLTFDFAPVVLTTSPDGRRVAYATREGDKQFVIVDGKPQKRYDGIGSNVVFSPDSKRFAYRAQAGNKQIVVVEGIEGKHYDVVGSTIVFSPDSQRVAYAAKLGKRCFLVVDGKEGKYYEGGIGSNIVFSPDSQHLAYGVQSGKRNLWLLTKKRESLTTVSVIV